MSNPTPTLESEFEAPEIVDLLERADSSGVIYLPDQVKEELKYSTFDLPGCDDHDIKGEKIIILRGPHGVGKSVLVQEFGIENGFEVATANLGGTVQEDLHGNPIIKQNPDGTMVTGHAAAEMLPPFVRAPKSKSGKGILLLDEIFSGSSMDHQLFVRMVSARRCDELKMFPGWYVVGTTNPNNNAYMAVRKIDASTSDRFIIFNVDSNDEAKLAYWRNTMPQTTFKFLLLNHVRELSYVSATSARNWWNLSIEIEKRQKAGAPALSVSRLLATHVNRVVADEFMTYLNHGSDLNFYPITAKDLEAAETDRQMEQLIGRLKRWVNDDNTPLIGASKWDLTMWMREDIVKKNQVPTARVMKNLAAFVVELGTKNYVDFADDLFRALMGSTVQQTLLDLTADTPLRQRMLDVMHAYKKDNTK